MDTIPIRTAWLNADLHATASLGTDRAGNPVLCLRVVLLEGTNIGQVRGGADNPGTADRLLDEPAAFVVKVDPHSLADLCRTAQMNRSRKAKMGPLVAHAVVHNPRVTFGPSR